jgi:hypothetical protein
VRFVVKRFVVIIADERWGWHDIIVKRSVVRTAFVAATVIDARAIVNVITIHVVVDVAIVKRFIVESVVVATARKRSRSHPHLSISGGRHDRQYEDEDEDEDAHDY